MSDQRHIVKSILEEIVDFWFSVEGETFWFNCYPYQDEYITNKYKKYIEEMKDEIIIDNKKQKLGYIIYCDQLVRHFYRNDKDKNIIINYFLIKIIKIVNEIINNNEDMNYLPQQRCFILMPLRHTFDVKNLEIVIDRIKLYRKESDSKYYIRFFKTTLTSYSSIKSKQIQPKKININISEKDIIEILDEKSSKNLKCNGILTCFNKYYKIFNDIIKKIPADKFNKTIVLSISGGVDSMVSSYIINSICRIKKYKFICVMINYNNRGYKCDIEVEFVRKWLESMNTENYTIEFYVRDIWELHRETEPDRDFYEKITRNMRFDMYKRFNSPVFLGHNLEDSVENIFSNISKNRNFDNLLGMDTFCVENDCLIVRPMLEISKKDIIKFAHEINIPYLEDSTPKWSVRGRMRDILIPQINQFDATIISGLITLSKQISDIYKMYELSIIKPFISKINKNNDIIKINININSPEIQYGFIFWKDIIKYITKTFNKPLPSNSSINSFVIRINNKQYGDIYFTKTFKVIYSSNAIIFI